MRLTKFLLASFIATTSGTGYATAADADVHAECVDLKTDELSSMGMRGFYLQATLSNDVAPLRQHLSEWLTGNLDVYAQSLDAGLFCDKQREKFMRTVRFIAVLHEHFPNREWSENQRIVKLFQQALDLDPAHTELLRRQNWSKAILKDGLR